MPLVEEMLSHERPYTNSELEKYREAAYDVLYVQFVHLFVLGSIGFLCRKGSSVEVMSSAYVAALGRIEDSKDGLHYGGKMMQLVCMHVHTSNRILVYKYPFFWNAWIWGSQYM